MIIGRHIRFLAVGILGILGGGTAMAKPPYFEGRNTALQRAVDANDPGAVERALADGADVNARERQVNATILEYAVAQLRDAAIPVLLRHGADPSLRDKESANAVTTAADAWFKDHEPLRLLLEAGADPNTRDEEGDPILQQFLTQKREDAIDLLVKHKVDINAVTAGDYDPKHQSAAKAPNGRPLILSQANSDDWDMVYKLLQLGAKFDYPTSPATMSKWYAPQFENTPGKGSELYNYKVLCWKFMTERGLKLPPFAGMR